MDIYLRNKLRMHHVVVILRHNFKRIADRIVLRLHNQPHEAEQRDNFQLTRKRQHTIRNDVQLVAETLRIGKRCTVDEKNVIDTLVRRQAVLCDLSRNKST